MSLLKFSRDFIESTTGITCSACYIHKECQECFIGYNTTGTKIIYHFEIINNQEYFCEVIAFNKKVPTLYYATTVLKNKYFFLRSLFNDSDPTFNLLQTPINNIWVNNISSRQFYSKESLISSIEVLDPFITAFAFYIYLVKTYYFLKEASFNPSSWKCDFYFPNQLLINKVPLSVAFAIVLKEAVENKNTKKILEYQLAKTVTSSKECQILFAVLKSFKRSKNNFEKQHQWIELINNPKLLSCPVFRWYKAILKEKNIISCSKKNSESCCFESTKVCLFSHSSQPRNKIEHRIFCNYTSLTGFEILNFGLNNLYQAKDLCRYLLIERENHTSCLACFPEAN